MKLAVPKDTKPNSGDPLLAFFDPPEPEEIEKRLQIGMKLRVNPTDADSALTYITIRKLKGGETLDVVILWKHDVRKALTGLNATTGVQQYPIVEQVLEGQPLSAFRNGSNKQNAKEHLMLREAAKAAAEATESAATGSTALTIEAAGQAAWATTLAPAPSVTCIEEGMYAVISLYCPPKALAKQKRWMRRTLKKTIDMSVRDFANRIQKMNEDLKEFPPFTHHVSPQTLREDELTEIFVHACPKRWLRKMDELDFDYLVKDTQEIIAFLERMEASEATDFDEVRNDSKTNGKGNGKKKNAKKGKKSSGDGSFYCLHHGKNTSHNTDDCMVLKALAKEAKGGNGNKPKSKNKTWTKKAADAKSEVKKEIQAFIKKAEKSRKKELNAFIKEINAKKRKPSDEDEALSVSSGSVNQMDLTQIDFDDLDETDVKSVSCEDDHSFATANETS